MSKGNLAGIKTITPMKISLPGAYDNGTYFMGLLRELNEAFSLGLVLPVKHGEVCQETYLRPRDRKVLWMEVK